METLKLFGKRVRELRLSKNLTQADLADEIGVSDTFIAKIERGESPPSLKTMESLAKALEVQITQLFAFDKPLNLKTVKKLDSKDKAVQKLLRNKTLEEIEFLLQIEKLMKRHSRKKRK